MHDGLDKVPYNKDNYDEERECAICMLEFKKEEMVTQLKCNSKHYFHSKCLETWIKHGNKTCVICRTEIAGIKTVYQNESGYTEL